MTGSSTKGSNHAGLCKERRISGGLIPHMVQQAEVQSRNPDYRFLQAVAATSGGAFP